MSIVRTSRFLLSVATLLGVFTIQLTPTSATASADGIAWTQQTPASSIRWEVITYGDGLFVAASNNGAGDTTNNVMTSPDGVTWTSRTADPATGVIWKDITYSAALDLFVVVGSSGQGNVNGNIMTSPDGITWTARTLPATPNLRSVAFGSFVVGGVSVSRFVAIAENGALYSANGVDWTASTFATSAGGYSGVAFGGGKFVAVSSNYLNVNVNGNVNGSQVMTSPDGITWTQSDVGVDKQWKDVTYGGSQFVAVALQSATPNDTALVMTSPDGVTWTSQTAVTGAYWYSITYGNGIFVAVSSYTGTQIMTSPDAVAWTARSTPIGGGFNQAAFGNNTFVVVGYAGKVIANGLPTPPAISGISPTSGTTAGGTAITITGTLFAAGATVAVGGTACTSVVVASATSITCTSPAGTAGVKDVVVTNTDNGTVTSAGAFTYTAPVVNNPSSDSGPTYRSVLFDSNGGTGTTPPVSNYTATALPAHSLVKPGFVFTSWNTKADGTGIAYADKATYTFSSDVTLYAQWVPVKGAAKVKKYISTFEGDKAVLKQSMKAEIASWIKKLPKNASITCQGSTSGSKVTAFDKKLASNRAKNVCDAAVKLRSDLTYSIQLNPSSANKVSARHVWMIQN